MLEVSLPVGLREKALRIAAGIGKAQTLWPEQILLSAGGVSIYDCFPYLFAAAFPQAAGEKLDEFASAARLYASSIFLQDKVFDRGPVRESHQDVAPLNSMRIVAMQWEAYRILHRLFPADCAFWEHFGAYLQAYAAAVAEEQRFAGTGRDWSEYTPELALRIATGKNGVARATIAGLCELEGDSSALEPLTAAIDCYNRARQMWDDLQDWEEDLRSQTPSLLLARILGRRPDVDVPYTELKDCVARQLYYGGHATTVLQLALENLDRAGETVARWPELAWREVNADLRRECRLLLADLEQIVYENVARVSGQSAFELEIGAPASAWQRLAWPALEYLIGQWSRGFGEARHVMHFPPEAGFGGPPYQRGDVFQRAIIADVLCDARDSWGLELGPVIDAEARYLAQRRDDGRGGWRYFPDLPELPPDADDLAQVMQVLWRSGLQHELLELCAEPVAVLLDNCRHSDGSFETWVIPRHNRTREEARQAEFARTMWGTGPDLDVMANLLYALRMIDCRRYAGTIAAGADYLGRQQSPAGNWTGTWYHGPQYVTYVCLRLLCGACPDSEHIARAAAFVRTTQQADGGWGCGPSSDPLNTALGLLALSCVQGTAHARSDDAHAATAALEYLTATAAPDGSWPACEFIRMDTGRATGAPSPIVSYGSATVTTTFVAKAAAAWDARPRG